jgi:hypothetical protein
VTSFEQLHADRLLGKLEMCDRILFKGHLTRLYWPGGFQSLMCALRVRLKEFKEFVSTTTDGILDHAKELAAKAKRPYLYLDRPMTAKTGRTKEDYAREIAERDGIREGLVTVFSTLEPCTSFEVVGNRATHHLEVRWARRRCLFLYFYYVDHEFGFMHVRLQTWFPFEMQIYVNGHEWLARQLDRSHIGYERQSNAFVRIDDLVRAQRLCERFFHLQWHRYFDVFAHRLNVMLSVVEHAGYGSYFWSIDQAEFSTDLLFRSRQALDEVVPDLFEHATLHTGPTDILRFFDRHMNGRFTGDLTTRLKRQDCIRIKHSLRRNSIKMYVKGSVLRIETTVNNPREFKVLRRARRGQEIACRWCPMGKGVANFFRTTEVSRQANTRYLESLASAQLKGEALKHLDRLCRSTTEGGIRHSGFQPLRRTDHDLFRAALNGASLINGFRNKDICERLFRTPSRSKQERLRRCGQVSRLIRKMRAHHLVAKVSSSRLYRVTQLGHSLMGATITMRQSLFPRALHTAG